jgi:hypothetical protein
MHERLKALAVVPLLLLCGEERVPAMPQDDVTCRFRHRVETVESLRALPEWLKRYVHKQFDPIADRGEFFNSTDVIMRDGPARRFIRAGHSGAHWFLWYEQGGIAYFKTVVMLTARGDDARDVMRQTYFRENPCAITDHLLDHGERAGPAAE